MLTIQYCTILNDLSPLHDRDRLAKIFILAAYQVAHDMTKILAGLARMQIVTFLTFHQVVIVMCDM